MKVCALIPVYDEAERIAAVVAGAREHVAEVLVIDDGSRDGTAERARQAGADCLRLDRNQGKGAALRLGIAHVRDRDFTHLLLMDGDGQHAPADIPVLLRVAAESGADLVIGARTFDRGRMPRARYFSNTMGSRVASLLVGHQIRDSQSGFRLIRLDRLRQLQLRARRYEFEMEVLIKVARAGGAISHAPVTTVYDGGGAGSKMRPVRDTVRICLWSLLFRFMGW